MVQSIAFLPCYQHIAPWVKMSSGHMWAVKAQISLRIRTDRLEQSLYRKVDTIYRCVTKTCLYNFDPLKPHFYIVKLGFTRVNIIFLISAQKHRLWVLVLHVAEAVLTRNHNLCFEQKYEKHQIFFFFFI